MQRYTLVGDRRGWPSFEITAEMRPCDVGMWCSHDDHVEALAAKDAEINKLKGIALGLTQKLALIAWWCGAADSKVSAAIADLPADPPQPDTSA